MHLNKWNDDMHYALGFSKLWCKTLGIWPWQHDELFSSIRTGASVSIVVAAALLLLQQLLTKGNCGLMTELVDSLSGITAFSGTAIKIFVPWFQQQHMRHLLSTMMDDWLSISKSKSHEIMYRYAYWGRLAFILQISGTFVVMVITMLAKPPTLITTIPENGSDLMRSILMGPSCWTPITMPINLYLFYYYLIFIAMCCTAFTYAGCDAFMFSAALHICGQFEILEASIENLTDQDNYLQQKEKIKRYAKRHDQLIHLGENMDAIVNGIILSELLGNSFLICASGIVILNQLKEGSVNGEVINFALRIYVWYMQFFMYCYVGEKLSNHSKQLQTAIYNCPWYNMPIHIAKDIKFMIMRNNSFCYLTAGKIFVMNHQGFKEITRIMFSFFSVLRFMLGDN
nr:odorant receptor 13a [Fopius arisanus]